MPYIVCVNKPGELPETNPTAVSSVEEMRDAARSEYNRSRESFEYGPDDPERGEWLDHFEQIDDLGDAIPLPAVIGPMPDGYVIDVTHVEWLELARRSGDESVTGARDIRTRAEQTAFEQEILDAYNAQD